MHLLKKVTVKSKKVAEKKVKKSAKSQKVREKSQKVPFTFFLSYLPPRHYLQVCSSWIGCGISRDINDVKRIQQLLVHSLDKIGASQGEGVGGDDSSTQQQQQIARRDYSESSYTLETLAVLKAWAQVSCSNKGEFNDFQEITVLNQNKPYVLENLNLLFSAFFQPIIFDVKEF